jgi:glycosyltransferase involved in cell wall biosynthesis
MRVLHASHQYRPALGGAEYHITSLSEELVRRGHGITVFTSRSRDYRSWRSELPQVEDLDGVKVHRFRAFERGARTYRILDHGYRHYWRSGSRLYEPLILLGNGPVCPGLFWSLLRQGPDYDLVHINNLHYAHAAMAYLAARWRGLPVVTTPHVHAEQRITYDVRYMWEVLRGSDQVVADTPGERQFLIDAGLDHQRTTTAGVGIDVEAFPVRDRLACRQELGLPADAFILLFLGRKTEYKGLDTVLEAFATLLPDHPQLHLLAVGPETSHSQELWTRYEGLPRLTVLDRVPNETRLSALNACDCLVMPSSGEAFGLVYLEAWAVGKPVIGARTRAVSSLVSDGQDGYLVPAARVSLLADRIATLAKDPARGRLLGERGRAKVMHRYTIPRVTDIIEGVYLRALRRHGQQAQQRPEQSGNTNRHASSVDRRVTR